MWRTSSGGVSLREAPGQSAGAAAIKARIEAAILRNTELQAGSVDDPGYVPGGLILKHSHGVAARQKAEYVEPAPRQLPGFLGGADVAFGDNPAECARAAASDPDHFRQR